MSPTEHPTASQVFELSNLLRINSCKISSSLRCSAESSVVCSLAGGDGGATEGADLVFSACSAAMISSTTAEGASACEELISCC